MELVELVVLVELALDAEVLDAELAVEALEVDVVLVALEGSALWRAPSRFRRSLLSCEIGFESGGGGAVVVDVPLAEKKDEAEVVLELDVEAAA